jgi:superfamily II DNA or RNA helicase
MAVQRVVQSQFRDLTPEQDFRNSIWYRMAECLSVGAGESEQKVTSKSIVENGQDVLKVYDAQGSELLAYLSDGSDRLRFEGRCLDRPQSRDIPSRAAVLSELALWTLSENERKMLDRGLKSRRMALEEKFWYIVAYHAYRECGNRKITLHTVIDPRSGDFNLNVFNSKYALVFRIRVPRLRVKTLIEGLKGFDPDYQGLKIHPLALISLFKITQNANRDVEIAPMLQLTLPNGRTHLREKADLQKFRYGDLYYFPDLDILGKHHQPKQLPAGLDGFEKRTIKKEDVPGLLTAFGQDFANGPFIPDKSIGALTVFKRPDQIHINPSALERDWCWISVTYGFGNGRLSLSEILQARAEGRRFIEVSDGWMDTQSAAYEALEKLLEAPNEAKSSKKRNRVKLSRLDLLRLQATAAQALQVGGPKSVADRLTRLLNFKPVQPLPQIKGMTSTLRDYQQVGVEWISFLYENGFGGLLCDDMGLGKTHEVMAFMQFLRRHRNIKKPFLVVCPTTVLSHWDSKIREHAPDLKAAVYHGGMRDFKAALETGDVLLTSYGILRRDIAILRQRAFGLAVFDEIQNIKNHLTLAYAAAVQIRARMKLGLTGTPIENSLIELKALMDLVIPGYLGNHEDFKTRYVQPIEDDTESRRRGELTHLISPFTLRRLKSTVLSELPPKIEDIRTCRLSDDQIKLYRDAVASRGQALIQVLQETGEHIPYLHIFALLTLLKQICNHPATVEGNLRNYDRYQSGKWELFKELLAESLDSGQKVVVYSQYLDMIRIIGSFLTSSKVDFATLTGASRRRGHIIDRFNNDPDCRVFVGSLKAGGTGIDLVAASVVIHYDRWWNAAKEDQATDRVHRIGQKRGVQVFKLVTEGTLEEKISALITRKKNLMNDIVKEDDPGLLKTFSRDQLVELLSVPD